MKVRLVQMFTPEGHSEICKAAFFNAQPAAGEPGASFIYRLQQLAEPGFPHLPDADKDDIVKGLFLTKVKDPLSTYLNREYRNKSLDEIELAATNFEIDPKVARGLEPIVEAKAIDQQRIFMGFALKDGDQQGLEPSMRALQVSNPRKQSGAIKRSGFPN